MAREQEIYLGFCERWRNLPKPTIALVQGKVIAGGLMLMWPCDLIVAARRCRVPRPHRGDGRRRRGVLRPSVGDGRPQGQGVAVHRRLASRPRRRIASAWSTTSCRATSSRLHLAMAREDRAEAAVRAEAHQGGGQRRAGRAGPGAARCRPRSRCITSRTPTT